MPGFERTRFVGLSDGIADGFTCNVCFNIFENPVITDCGHTYCHQCVQELIQSGSHDCPKCRKGFRGRNDFENSNNDNSVMVEHNEQIYVFVRNLTVNAIISQFMIRCDYEWNGCRAVVELGLLESHLKSCEHRICRTCSLTLRSEEHNCVELLKNEVNEWRIKCKQFELNFNEMIDKCSEIEELNSNNERLRDEWKTKCSRYGKTVELLKQKCDESEAKHRNSLEMMIEWKQKCLNIYGHIKEENSKLKEEKKMHLIEISEYRDKCEECENRCAQIETRLEESQRKFQNVLDANHNLKHHCVSLERTLYQLCSKISSLESENHKLTQQNNGLMAKNTEAEKTCKDLRIKIYDLEAKIQEIEFPTDVQSGEFNPSDVLKEYEQHSHFKSDQICKACGLSVGSVADHHCLRQLKREANRWRNKFEESERTLAKVRDKYASVVSDNLINIKESYKWRDKCENYQRMARELKKDMETIEGKLRVCSLNFVNKEMNKWREKCGQYEQQLNDIDKKYFKHSSERNESCGRRISASDQENITSDNTSKIRLIEDEHDKCELANAMKQVNGIKTPEANRLESDPDKDVAESKSDRSENKCLTISAKQSLMYSENVNYVIFGTYRTKCSNFHINCNGILLKGVLIKGLHDIYSKDVIIPFQSMEELRFCSKLFTMALLIKANDVCTLDIQKLLHLTLPSKQQSTSKHSSYDLKQNNIIIALNKKNQNLLNSMSEWLSAVNPRLKTESINWFKMKEIMDKIHS